MPIFEYRCRDCQKVTEFLEKADSGKKHQCSHCGSRNMEKLFSAFSPIVKQRASGGKCDSCPESKCPYSG